MTQPHKPTPAELQAAVGKTIPDVIAPNLRILFCGFNPGLYSAAIGHHFARPGNRFWPALHQAGFTDRLFAATEDRLLLQRGYGLTNLVARATATADELTREELVVGRKLLSARVQQYQPKVVAILGIGAYRTAFGQRKASLGPQPDPLAGARLWVLPNPSGLNSAFQLPELVKRLREMRESLA